MIPRALRIRPRFLVLLAIALAVPGAVLSLGVSMPGQSHTGPLPPLTEAQRALAGELRRDVTVLASEIGERNTRVPKGLDAARAFVRRELAAAGYAVREETWQERGVECANVIAELAGSREILVVGAHYDSVAGCPGANDNGSGVAAVLAIARRMARSKCTRTVRFVLFANEEPPFFGSSDMGSAYHARACRKNGEHVFAMLSLETLGCYSDEPGSQRYPLPGLGWVYPTTGNFITFVGNFASRARVRDAVRIFRETTEFPSEGAALPGLVPGVGWSDQLSFWNEGYDALMVTDTAPFRYAHYHTAHDTPDKLDYERTARVVEGLQRVIERGSGAR
jgi:hypothetical protein